MSILKIATFNNISRGTGMPCGYELIWLDACHCIVITSILMELRAIRSPKVIKNHWFSKDLLTFVDRQEELCVHIVCNTIHMQGNFTNFMAQLFHCARNGRRTIWWQHFLSRLHEYPYRDPWLLTHGIKFPQRDLEELFDLLHHHGKTLLADSFGTIGIKPITFRFVKMHTATCIGYHIGCQQTPVFKQGFDVGYKHATGHIQCTSHVLRFNICGDVA